MTESHEAFLELSRRDPFYFLQNLIIHGPKGPDKWGKFMADFQKRDFKSMIPALMYLAGVTDKKPKHQRFFIQRSRGSSKTTDIAAVTMWLLMFANKPLDGICCAEDGDQASLVRTQMMKIAQGNPWILDIIDIKKKEIENKTTKAKLTIMTSDEMSSFGLTPDFTIADEFSHWTSQSFWSSVFSSFTKRADFGGILIVACNAGAGYDWKYKVKEMAMENELWVHSAPDGYASWYSKAAIEEQRAGLPEAEFSRLWLNRWASSLGEFVSVEEADRCIDPNLVIRDATQEDGWVYVAALDYAEKTDRTVGVVTHVYGETEDTIIVDRMDVIDPETVGGSVRLEWCEQWIRNVQRDFGGNNGRVCFVLDKYQLLYLIQKLSEEGFFIEAFDFAAGVGNWELSLILRQLILHQKVRWPEGTGKIYNPDGTDFKPENGRDDLSTELGNLTIKKMMNGKKWRIDHVDGGHDDRAFALGACCRFIVQNSGGFGHWNINEPSPDGTFRLDLA